MHNRERKKSREMRPVEVCGKCLQAQSCSIARPTWLLLQAGLGGHVGCVVGWRSRAAPRTDGAALLLVLRCQKGKSMQGEKQLVAARSSEAQAQDSKCQSN